MHRLPCGRHKFGAALHCRLQADHMCWRSRRRCCALRVQVSTQGSTGFARHRELPICSSDFARSTNGSCDETLLLEPGPQQCSPQGCHCRIASCRSMSWGSCPAAADWLSLHTRRWRRRRCCTTVHCTAAQVRQQWLQVTSHELNDKLQFFEECQRRLRIWLVITICRLLRTWHAGSPCIQRACIA